MKIKCPTCQHGESKTVDGRPRANGTVFRRRRQCLKCGHRWTTFETAQQPTNLVLAAVQKAALETLSKIRKQLESLIAD
jgi:transcriptional regulator NrdR family protein